MITKDISVEQTLTKETILKDYQLACESREASLIGRKEVFMGKAKFGIFGDGKEVAQLAMAQAFRKGDFRSGYYRDQTFMLAIGELTLQQYFAQLYAHTSVEAEPVSAGRMMNGHFGTRLLDDEGQWKNQADAYNATADISPTAGQMPRILGLAYASKLYRQNEALHHLTDFSNKGDEISFGTIGNASTSEGLFYETINAAGVLQVPMLMSVWDDEYGISVPKEYHTTKGNISKVLNGFKRTKKENGYEIFVVKGWDYEALVDAYQQAAEVCRTEHVPVLVHVVEMTQPQGHSTSGSHERYKSKERLAWEAEYDCIKQMREWIISQGHTTEAELEEVEKVAKNNAKEARKAAWKAFVDSMKGDHNEAVNLLSQTAQSSSENVAKLTEIHDQLKATTNPLKRDAVAAIKKALRVIRTEQNSTKHQLIAWLENVMDKGWEDYSSHLYSQSSESPLNIPEIKPIYNDDSKLVDGREVLQACFDAALERDPRVFAFGEDVGKIGDVNQAFAGLQAKHGELRVTDTGIREATIIGQGIGAAMRGLRPIAEIQYLDYIYYAVQILADDLSCLQYRTKGGQKSPLIIRTRGHRLEGIWHTGSPIGTLLHSLRGIHVLVPRDMTQAAGFYNTMLQSDDPALIIECLNGYRLKEKLPANIGEFTVPLGIPETIKEGSDITIVTYGSMCRIVMDAAQQLEEVGINCEVIDVQSLLPFDLQHRIVESIKKTNRVLFADEDVPGGASAFMMQKVVEEQNAYRWLDSAPATLAAKEHRAAYGSDGDYFSKPSVEDVFDKVYEMMREADPVNYPAIY